MKSAKRKTTPSTDLYGVDLALRDYAPTALQKAKAKRIVAYWQKEFGVKLDPERTARHLAMLAEKFP